MRTQKMTPLLLLGAVLAARAAEPPNAKTTAYQTSVSQEQLRSQARRLKDEMAALLSEFGEYKAAGAELTRLKEATDQLDTSSQAEMLAVVQTLREASRTGTEDDARSKLAKASGEQKDIQALLRRLADRLILQKDAAAMQQRVKDLALRQVANLRAAKDLAASGAKPDKVPAPLRSEQAVAKAEQEALKNEVKLAMETLRKLAQNPEAAKNDTFKQALAAAEKSGLEEQTKQAAEKNATDFAEAAQSAKAVADGLQNMLQELRKSQTAAEQSRVLAQEMKELAQHEEQLAKTSARSWGGQERELKKEQQLISNKLEVAKQEMAKLNPAAAAQAAQAEEKSEQLADSLKSQAMTKVDAAAKTADAQREVAKQLNAASEMLQKQADALAANSPAQEAPQSPAETAVGEAVKQVMDAKSQLGLAQRQLQQKGEQAEAKQRLAQAETALKAAEQKAAEAGAAVPASVGEQLQQAQANAAKAEQGVGQGSKEQQEHSRWDVDKAEQNANRALEGLQQAANQLATQAAAKTAGNKPGPPSKDGKAPGKAATSQSKEGGANGLGTDDGQGGQTAATARQTSGQREALSLLQKEKAPAEYESMVQQYVRSLAESADPAP